EACREIDATFVTFSTDYVFDGVKREPYLENDQPAPLQIYGITKLSGEFAALSAAPAHSVIVRTCGLYGLTGGTSRGGNFVDKRLLDAANGKPVEIASEQVVCPTYTEDLARATLGLLKERRPTPGVYHLVNDGQCSWYEFTVEIYRQMKLDVQVVPVDRGGTSGKMRRPLYSALANTKARCLGIKLPHWKDALERYLAVKYGA
ncbi:MAG: NAD(P)-dependent oxidoreductase, partial [Clostridiales bacterium]|nr:NAD(P)-dependent oxidoreductase [Clostridiales bacterium]